MPDLLHLAQQLLEEPTRSVAERREIPSDVALRITVKAGVWVLMDMAKSLRELAASSRK